MPEERNSSHRANSDAQRKAVAKYHSEKIETIAVRVPKGQKAYYQEAAAAAGLSLNQFAIMAMNEKIAASSSRSE